MSSPESLSSETLRAAQLLFAPGQVVEVRVPKAGQQRTVAGYFDDFEKLAKAAAALEAAKHPGVYWTINQVDPALLSRAVNRVKGYAGSGDLTGDDNILRRHWLPIDHDPKRPAGISSNESEHAAALEMAKRVQGSLRDAGWPEGIFADSGNGAHLLYRIDLPNDHTSSDLVQRVLQALAARFGTEQVEIDLATFNASRIFKAYGTTARKGDDTKERPHRRSCILQAPATVSVVPLELLQLLAGESPKKMARSITSGRSNFRLFDLQRFLDQHGLRYRTPVPFEGGRKFVLEHCPFDPSHTAPDAAVFERPDGYGFHCFHNSCQGRAWRDFRELFEPAANRGDGFPESPEPVWDDAAATSEEPSLGPSIPNGIFTAPANDPRPRLGDYLYNDHGNAERLIAFRGKDLLYCPQMNGWFCWDGRRWARDAVGRARQMVKETQLEAMAQAIEFRSEAAEKFAKASMDSKRITNALLEAQCRLAVMADDLDQDPHVLNFQNGSVDLRSGELQPHSREDRITRVLDYVYDPKARCPTFHRFLDEVTGGGPDVGQGDVERSARLVDYLQVAFGYSLTGVTSEKAVFLLHGPRDNGKSTLLATFLRLLDGYAIVLQIDSLMIKPGVDSNNAQADLADLRGARFVMTSETEEGQRLAEGKLKRITQGIGRIKATRKYENPIEFDESHKLWVDANHLPVIRSYDDATWRRLHTIPFTVVIPRERQDRSLGTKLLAEGEGILAWAVRGAVRWYAEGLSQPGEVEESSGAWRREMDRIAAFVDECCNRGAGQVKAKQFYEAYKGWAESNGERPMSGRAFAERLREAGIDKKVTGVATFYVGVCLRAPLFEEAKNL